MDKVTHFFTNKLLYNNFTYVMILRVNFRCPESLLSLDCRTTLSQNLSFTSVPPQYPVRKETCSRTHETKHN